MQTIRDPTSTIVADFIFVDNDRVTVLQSALGRRTENIILDKIRVGELLEAFYLTLSPMVPLHYVLRLLPSRAFI